MLPPLFCFDFSEKEPTYDEVKKYIKANGFCNKEHRLVKFLMKNSNVIEDKVPEFWNKTLVVLMQADGNTLVREVNHILDDLRRITYLEIQIPDSLYLTKTDVLETDAFR